MRVLLALAWLGAVVYAVHALTFGPEHEFVLFRDWIYGATILLSALVSFWRAHHGGPHRAVCLAFGWALLTWVGGTVVYVLVVAHQQPVPYPSLADGFWLAFYPAIYLALVFAIRERISNLPKAFGCKA